MTKKHEHPVLGLETKLDGGRWVWVGQDGKDVFVQFKRPATDGDDKLEPTSRISNGEFVTRLHLSSENAFALMSLLMEVLGGAEIDA